MEKVPFSSGQEKGVKVIFPLNSLQKYLSAVSILFLLAIVLFPPWVEQSVAEFGPHFQQDRGRAFLFWAPRPTVGEKEVGIDWAIASLNVATIIVAWAALAIVLRGKFESIQEHILSVRTLLAVIIGGIAPVPPFVASRTYLPNLFFVLSAFAETGHIPSSSILIFGLVFWGAYSTLTLGLLWLLTRAKESA